ncbi:hypothetical protein ACFE04_004613 [Oxalis oulophora]
MEEIRKTPLWQIIMVASIAAGIQFGWALQLSLLTPYVQTLGVPHQWASFIWLCGPLSGLIVQPIVGYNSDRCTSKFGRRRPFIAGGGVFIALAVFLIGFAKDIGYMAGDSLVTTTKPRAVAVFVVGFWVLDVANNMLQGPCRAFLADLSNGDHKMMRISNGFFAFFMALGNVLGYAAGAYSNMHKLLPFTKTTACDITCANLKTCFLVDIILLIIVLTTSILTVKEIPITLDDLDSGDESKSSKSAFIQFITNMVAAIRTFKKPMWVLMLVTGLNWVAWFPFILFDTDWMGKEVYGGTADGSAHQVSVYEAGVRAGAIGLMINSAVLAVFSVGIEPLGRLIGGVKRVWGGVNLILAIGLGLTVLITKKAEHWRATGGFDEHSLPLPPGNIKAAALSVFGVLGLPLSVTFSVPFALASIYSSSSGGGQGLSLGILNLAIVIPQMFVSVVSGQLDGLFGGGNLAAFVMGAIAAVITVPLALFVLPNTPKQMPLNLPIGGGH